MTFDPYDLTPSRDQIEKVKQEENMGMHPSRSYVFHENISRAFRELKHRDLTDTEKRLLALIEAVFRCPR